MSDWLKTEQVNAEDNDVWLKTGKSVMKRVVSDWLKTEQVNDEDNGV